MVLPRQPPVLDDPSTPEDKCDQQLVRWRNCSDVTLFSLHFRFLPILGILAGGQLRSSPVGPVATKKQIRAIRTGSGPLGGRKQSWLGCKKLRRSRNSGIVVLATTQFNVLTTRKHVKNICCRLLNNILINFCYYSAFTYFRLFQSLDEGLSGGKFFQKLVQPRVG